MAGISSEGIDSLVRDDLVRQQMLNTAVKDVRDQEYRDRALQNTLGQQKEELKSLDSFRTASIKLQEGQQLSLDEYRKASNDLEKQKLGLMQQMQNAQISRNYVEIETLNAKLIELNATQQAFERAANAKSIDELSMADRARLGFTKSEKDDSLNIAKFRENIDAEVAKQEAYIGENPNSAANLGSIEYVNKYGNRPYIWMYEERGMFGGKNAQKIPLPIVQGKQMTTEILYKLAEQNNMTPEAILKAYKVLPE